jgi:multiple sugar transport system permease protein
MSARKGTNLKKAIRMTTLYIVVAGIVLILLTPIFFIVSLSFMSTREAYQYPLPLLPDFTTEFELRISEDGYLLSVYNNRTDQYESVQDTIIIEDMTYYMKAFLNTLMSDEELQEHIDILEAKVDVEGQEAVVYFEVTRDILQNYRVFFRITRDAVPSLIRSLQVALITMVISLFPAVAIAIPMLIILARMGFYDMEIPFGLALVYSVGSIGLTIWITGSIFLGIPVALEEAVQVFGGNRLQAFLRVTLPLAFPGLAASAMYAFLGAWNETVAAIILTEFNPTFAVVVYSTLLGTAGQVNLAAASGMAMAIPAVIFTFFIRKYINQMWGGVTV